MKPADKCVKKFRQETRYPHKRSEGLTRRTNRGSVLQTEDKRNDR